jgi:hypothetical protein
VDGRFCAHTPPAQKIDVRQLTLRCDLKHCQHLKTNAARDRATTHDGSKGIDVRTHCFISTTSANARGARWAWHTADDNGVSRLHSDTEFENFNACVDDARAHGYHHVEVPVLHWSCARGDALAGVQSARPATIESAAAPVYTVSETQ